MRAMKVDRSVHRASMLPLRYTPTQLLVMNAETLGLEHLPPTLLNLEENPSAKAVSGIPFRTPTA